MDDLITEIDVNIKNNKEKIQIIKNEEKKKEKFNDIKNKMIKFSLIK